MTCHDRLLYFAPFFVHNSNILYRCDCTNIYIHNHKYYNFHIQEDLVLSLMPKLITCFINGSTSKMRYQPIACTPFECEEIYWSLDLEGATISFHMRR